MSCAIHYGQVLTGNSSKPLIDLYAHLLSLIEWAFYSHKSQVHAKFHSCSQWYAFVLTWETEDILASHFCAWKGRIGEPKNICPLNIYLLVIFSIPWCFKQYSIHILFFHPKNMDDGVLYTNYSYIISIYSYLFI